MLKELLLLMFFGFNRRKMPTYAFEIETTTNFTEAFSRYFALQDFHIEFCIIADKGREKGIQRQAAKEMNLAPSKKELNL